MVKIKIKKSITYILNLLLIVSCSSQDTNKNKRSFEACDSVTDVKPGESIDFSGSTDKNCFYFNKGEHKVSAKEVSGVWLGDKDAILTQADFKKAIVSNSRGKLIIRGLKLSGQDSLIRAQGTASIEIEQTVVLANTNSKKPLLASKDKGSSLLIKNSEINCQGGQDGLAFYNSNSNSLENSKVTKCANYSVVVNGAKLKVDNLRIEKSTAVSLFIGNKGEVEGTSLYVDEMDYQDTIAKAANPAYGIVVYNGSSLKVDNIDIKKGVATGITAINAVIKSQNIMISDLKSNGLIVYNDSGDPSFQVDSLEIKKTMGVAILLKEPRNFSITRGIVEDTQLLKQGIGGIKTAIADGVNIMGHLNHPGESIQFNLGSLTLKNNMRAGLVFDGGHGILNTNHRKDSPDLFGAGIKNVTIDNSGLKDNPDIKNHGLVVQGYKYNKSDLPSSNAREFVSDKKQRIINSQNPEDSAFALKNIFGRWGNGDDKQGGTNARWGNGDDKPGGTNARWGNGDD